ncbi:Phosphotriesterase [Trinorchestia longiramus]|nr:Phosphotriesterase [Trinorchestia longiramus]
MTVTGPVEPSSLGQTLPHEHVSVNFGFNYVDPGPCSCDAPKTECDFTLPNLGWIRQNPYSHKKNIKYSGDEVAGLLEHEFIKFKKAGYYVSASLSSPVLEYSTEQLYAVLVDELTVGCKDDPSIRCGIIGEIGCSWPITDFERRSISAAGMAQEQTGAPVMFHPGRHHDAPAEIFRIYSEAGGDIKHAVMGHLDRTIHTMDGLAELATLGSYLEYDLFGVETSHYQLNTAIDMPSDAQRIARIKHLVQCGYADRILISHDIHTRNRLTAYGGHGFCHIFENVVPKMISRGLDADVVSSFLTTNPQRWLTFSK